MILFLVLACQGEPEFLTMSGTVFGDEEASAPVANATIDVYDIAMEAIDSVQTDAEGNFEAQVRYGSNVLLDLQADGHMRTGFSGMIGISDYAVPDGVLWMRSQEAQAEVDLAFSACENLGVDGMIDGEVIMALPQDGNTVKNYVETGWAKVILEDGSEVQACYLDAEGIYDPDAVYTGEQGRFLIPGVSGKLLLRVGYDLGETEIYSVDLTVFVPEGGLSTFFDVLWMPLPG
jgi:hypothetical protein